MSVGVTDVGRKKKVEAERVDESFKPKTLGIRATGEWAAWVVRLARHCRLDFAKLVDSALVEYAKKHGFDEKPPERIP